MSEGEDIITVSMFTEGGRHVWQFSKKGEIPNSNVRVTLLQLGSKSNRGTINVRAMTTQALDFDRYDHRVQHVYNTLTRFLRRALDRNDIFVLHVKYDPRGETR